MAYRFGVRTTCSTAIDATQTLVSVIAAVIALLVASDASSIAHAVTSVRGTLVWTDSSSCALYTALAADSCSALSL
jgi:hypothetical protein